MRKWSLALLTYLVTVTFATALALLITHGKMPFWQLWGAYALGFAAVVGLAKLLMATFNAWEE